MDQPNDASISDLLRKLAQDAAALVRDEIALARLELRENVTSYLRDAARLGVAGVIALIGVLALITALILGLGALLDNYWLSALIVAVVLLAGAGLLARTALAQLRKKSVTPEATVISVKTDQRLIKREVRDFKRKLQA